MPVEILNMVQRCSGEPNATFMEVELLGGTPAALRVSYLSWEVTRHNFLVKERGYPEEVKLVNDQASSSVTFPAVHYRASQPQHCWHFGWVSLGCGAVSYIIGCLAASSRKSPPPVVGNKMTSEHCQTSLGGNITPA